MRQAYYCRFILINQHQYVVNLKNNLNIKHFTELLYVIAHIRGAVEVAVRLMCAPDDVGEDVVAARARLPIRKFR